MTVLSAAILLFLILDPLGNIPLFPVALKNTERSRWTAVIIREHLIALVLLVAFLFLGNRLLSVMGISEPALSMAGGIILFIIALKMIFPQFMPEPDDAVREEPLIVPLAIPLISGPTALTSVMLLGSREPERRFEWLLALGCAWLASCVILSLSPRLSAILGNRGLVALERLMGMVLTVVAVQMFITGIGQFIAG